jgi:hypothetical protein
MYIDLKKETMIDMSYLRDNMIEIISHHFLLLMLLTHENRLMINNGIDERKIFVIRILMTSVLRDIF